MKYMKYPRTPHLPFSEGGTDDDRRLENVDHFLGMDIVVTLKMDGENTSIYSDHIHARSLDSNNHPSRDWIKNRAREFQYKIPDGFRICGENLYAKHSIKYMNLESYFYIFSIWKEDKCFSWEETVNICSLVGLPHVPVLYKGKFDINILTHLYTPYYDGNEMEGFVVRNRDSFLYENFDRNVAKFVRHEHVQTDEHWMLQAIEKNGLKGEYYDIRRQERKFYSKYEPFTVKRGL
jgi:RNA ligase